MPSGGVCRFRVSNIDSSVTFNEFQEALGQLALDDVVVEPGSFKEDAAAGSSVAIIRLAPDEADILRGPMKEAKVFVDRSSGDSKGIKMELKFQEIKQSKETAKPPAGLPPEGEQSLPRKVQLAEPVQANKAVTKENSEEAERLDKALTPRPREEKPPLPPPADEPSGSQEVGPFDPPKASIMMEPQPRMAPPPPPPAQQQQQRRDEEPQREARPPRPAAEEDQGPPAAYGGRRRPEQPYDPPGDGRGVGRQHPDFDPPEESPQQRRSPFPPPGPYERSSPDRRGMGRSGDRDHVGQDWGMYRDQPWQEGRHLDREQPWQDAGRRRDQAGHEAPRASTPSSEQGEYFSHCSRMLETVDGQPKLLRTCVAQTQNCVVS